MIVACNIGVSMRSLRNFLVLGSIFFLSACLGNSSTVNQANSSLSNKKISISVKDTVVKENDNGSYYASVEVVFSQPLLSAENLTFTTLDGSARSGKDFENNTFYVKAAIGASSVKVDGIEILGDVVFETDEVFFLKAINTDAFDDEKSRPQASITIMNDDSPPNLKVLDATDFEMNKLNFEVIAESESEVDIVINFVTEDLSDATPDKDFDSNAGQVVLNAGSLSTSILIFAPYDTLDENPETFAIRINSPTPNITITDEYAVGTIVDNNNLPFVNFEKESVEYYETQGTATITVFLDTVSGKEVSIPLKVVSNDLSPSEYDSFPTSIIIPAGSISATASFTIADDTLMEPSEAVVFQIDESITDANIGSKNTFTINIAESDGLPDNLSNLSEKSIGFSVIGEFYKDRIVSRNLGDIDGDGADELIIQNTSGVSPNANRRFYVFWGGNRYLTDIDLGSDILNSDISLYLSSTNGSTDDVFTRMGDVNCDGIDDFYADLNDKYLVFGQENRTLTTSLTDFVSNSSRYTSSLLRRMGDINGDGCDDLAYSKSDYDIDYDTDKNSNEGSFYLKYSDESIKTVGNTFSLTSNSDLKMIGEWRGQRVGHQYSNSVIGDVNGDGFDDVLIGFSGSRNYIFWGKEQSFGDISPTDYEDHGIITSALNTNNSPSNGLSLGRTIDMNFDGYHDLLLQNSWNQYVYIVPGKSSGWNTNYRYYGSSPVSQNAMSWYYDESSSVQLMDLNADGYLDFVKSVAVDDDESRLSAIYVKWGEPYSSQKYTISSSYDHVIYGEKQGWDSTNFVRGDFNGDGIDDLSVSTRFSYTNNLDDGKVYVIYGGNLTNSVDLMGDDSDNSLIGSVSAEVFFGGAGDDRLVGNGGADFLQGGSGNDIIEISDYDFRGIDGGPGNDFIVLRNYNLDLSTGAVAKFRNIEGFDLSESSSSETLNLGRAATLKLNKKKKLRVKGSNNDYVNLTGPIGTWVSAGTVVFDTVQYEIYENTKSVGIVYIQTGVNVSFIN